MSDVKFVHPEEITDEIYDTERGTKGTNYLFKCHECDGKASFLPDIKSGHCFSCGIKYVLHSKYFDLPEEKQVDILEQFEMACPNKIGSYTKRSSQIGSNEAPLIKELSQEGLTYLKSRGINEKYAELFQLEEASYQGRKWIALKNLDRN